MEEQELQDVACRICGNDICCDPAHQPFRASLVFTCKDCGASVTVQAATPTPTCCGQQMFPAPIGLW